MIESIRKALSCLLLAFVLPFISIQQTAAQATCDPNQKYDRIVSGFHQSVVQKGDGSFVVWGEEFANNGTSNVLSPIALNATNYPAMTGTPLKPTIGGAVVSSASTAQGILLTTTGLFAWGNEGAVVDPDLTTSSTFQKIATPTGGDAATSLPTGVTPASVTMLFASYQTLALVTTAGNVWVLTRLGCPWISLAKRGL